MASSESVQRGTRQSALTWSRWPPTPAPPVRLRACRKTAAAEGRPQPPIDLTAAAFFDVDNTLVQGSSAVHFGRGLAARNYFTYRDVARIHLRPGQVSVARQGEQQRRRRRPAQSAHLHRGPIGRGAGASGRGDLRRDHRRQDLVGHPRAHADAPRRRPAGLADHRHALRTRGDHRAPARPDRRAGHRRRVRRRRYSPAGSSATSCTAPARRTRCGRWRSGRAST